MNIKMLKTLMIIKRVIQIIIMNKLLKKLILQMFNGIHSLKNKSTQQKVCIGTSQLNRYNRSIQLLELCGMNLMQIIKMQNITNIRTLILIMQMNIKTLIIIMKNIMPKKIILIKQKRSMHIIKKKSIIIMKMKFITIMKKNMKMFIIQKTIIMTTLKDKLRMKISIYTSMLRKSQNHIMQKKQLLKNQLQLNNRTKQNQKNQFKKK